MAATTLIRCGTCAWGDHEDFYPPGLKPGDRLSYYARWFPLVEVDSTFYSLQPQRNFALWAERTPPGFAFNVKAYRAMTRHDREPRPGEEDVLEVFRRFKFSLEPLAASGKLRAVHFQFPPWFVSREENREYVHFCREAFADQTVAVEFRHASWFDEGNREQTLAFLRRIDAAHVICDEPQVGTGRVPFVLARTSPRLVVFRLHGRNAKTWYIKDAKSSADRFDYLYNKEELAGIAQQVRSLAGGAADPGEVHVLLNNNRSNYAVRNALDMMELLDLPCPERDEYGLPRDPLRLTGVPPAPAKPEQGRLF